MIQRPWKIPATCSFSDLCRTWLKLKITSFTTNWLCWVLLQFPTVYRWLLHSWTCVGLRLSFNGDYPISLRRGYTKKYDEIINSYLIVIHIARHLLSTLVIPTFKPLISSSSMTASIGWWTMKWCEYRAARNWRTKTMVLVMMMFRDWYPHNTFDCVFCETFVDANWRVT